VRLLTTFMAAHRGESLPTQVRRTDHAASRRMFRARQKSFTRAASACQQGLMDCMASMRAQLALLRCRRVSSWYHIYNTLYPTPVQEALVEYGGLERIPPGVCREFYRDRGVQTWARPPASGQLKAPARA
jgi:hypothetical protein